MKRTIVSLAVSATCAIGVGALADTQESGRMVSRNLHPFANPSGAAATFSTATSG